MKLQCRWPGIFSWVLDFFFLAILQTFLFVHCTGLPANTRTRNEMISHFHNGSRSPLLLNRIFSFIELIINTFGTRTHTIRHRMLLELFSKNNVYVICVPHLDLQYTRIVAFPHIKKLTRTFCSRRRIAIKYKWRWSSGMVLKTDSKIYRLFGGVRRKG